MKNTVDHSIHELREMDELAAGRSPIHQIHPAAKLLVTVTFLLTVVSFSKYDWSGLWILILYPLLLFQISGISMKACLYKLRMVLPLVCAVGIFNPFLDRVPVWRLGSFVVTSGMISMVTLMLKGILCLTASFLLIATTRIDSVCGVLRLAPIPSMLTTLILLTYRYIVVMAEEVSIMTKAYSLRAPGHKGIHFSAWGSFLGQLLLRSMDKAEELYHSMLLRGYQGDFHYAQIPKGTWLDAAYACGWILFFVLARCFPLTRLLGGIILQRYTSYT